MIALRQSFYLSNKQLIMELISPRVIMAYSLGLISILNHTFDYLNYSATNSVQVFEPFILFFYTRANLTMALLGILLTFSDAPFVTAQSATLIYRTRRKVWAHSMCIYIVMQTIVYYLFLLIGSVVFAAGHAFTGNVWSRAIYQMAADGGDVFAVSKYGLTLPAMAMLQQGLPLTTALYAFILVCMYSIMLGLLLFILNLNFHKIVGSVITFLVHFSGYIIISDAVRVPVRFSLMANALLEWHVSPESGIDFVFSIAYFILVTFILYELLNILIVKTDFKISAAGK